MTYQEIKSRLEKCEYSLKAIKDGKYSNSTTDLAGKTQKLQFLKESLEKQLKEAEKGVIFTDDEKKAKDLADDGSNVQLTKEGPHQTTYIKISKADYKKAMDILDSNIDPTYVKMDVVDDDGAGNVIIYFNFRAKDDGEPDEDPAQFLYDVSMDLESNGISIVDKSHDVDEAKDINDPVLMKIRALQSKMAKKKAAKPSRQNISPEKIMTLKSKLQDLEDERADVLRNMEQEAEPEGGPIADDYGAILNDIDKKIDRIMTVLQKYDINEQESVKKLSKHEISSIAHEAGKAIVKVIHQTGDEVSQAKIKDIYASALSGDSSPGAFTIHIVYKNNSEVSYRFQIVNNVLYLLADNEDIKLSDVGIKPSGEPVINLELIKNEMLKYFKKISEMTDQEFADAKEKERLDKHPEKDTIMKIQALLAAEKNKMEGFNDRDDVFAFGYDLNMIQAVVDHLKSNYSEDDYELHIGRGDTHPNAVTLKNPEMNNDKELGNLLIAAEDQEETDYQSNRELEKDYMEEDKDIGHQDDEPNMLKSSAYETAQYAAKLFKKLNKYDKYDGEVDFPNWWQKKLILARDYMSAAFHYLDSEEKQPALEQLALEGNYTKEKLLAYLGQADDAMIRTNDDKYLIIYNPKSGNQDNYDMWGDYSVFAVDQDGGEHEVLYSDIDDFQLEGMKEQALGFYHIKKLGDKAASHIDIETRRDSRYTFGNRPYQDDQLRYQIAKKLGYNVDSLLEENSEMDKIIKAKRLIKQQAPAMNKLPQDDPKRKAFIDKVKKINQKHKELLDKEDDKIAGTGRDQELSEGRGDFDDVLKAIENMANNDDISERDAAAEIVLALADKFQLPVDKNLEDYMEESVNEGTDLHVDKDFQFTRTNSGIQITEKYSGYGPNSRYIHVPGRLLKRFIAGLAKSSKVFKDLKYQGQDAENPLESAPGYKHDCAAKVVHEKHGKGTCIPEKHTLVKEGSKYTVTHYDVLFESGKTVTDIPVSELEVKTQTEHWHKGYKKKKK